MSKFPYRVFSGIQPTGSLHIGNYSGAVKRWIELINENNHTEVNGLDSKLCSKDDGSEIQSAAIAKSRYMFCIVDLHALTTGLTKENHLNQSETLNKTSVHKDSFLSVEQKSTRLASQLIACGVNPKKCTIFRQSDVGSHHLELFWYLTCMSTVSQLSALSMFKDKLGAKGSVENAPLGLLTYPVLQSADILLYQATHIPVGEDNIQHVQLARKLSQKFNNAMCSPTESGSSLFPVPKILLTDSTDHQAGGKIRSLRSTKKMSKSDPDPLACLYLDDPPDIVSSKLRKAVTDSTSKITFDPIKRPAVANLISIHSAITGQTANEICEMYAHIDTGQYKTVITDAFIEKFSDVRKDVAADVQSKEYVQNVLQEGCDTAKQIGEGVVREARNLVLNRHHS